MPSVLCDVIETRNSNTYWKKRPSLTFLQVPCTSDHVSTDLSAEGMFC
jgi:hypothetical protein